MTPATTEDAIGERPVVAPATVGATVALEPAAASDGEALNVLPKMLRIRTIRSSAWSIFGYGTQQALRLVSTLVLSRLLAEEIYGLMTMISVLIQGLQMFSDIGIGPSIIANKRGNQRDYLDTAFTIQAIRGFGLWIVVCLLAWPWAVFNHQPQLLWLIPISGFNAVLVGFNSTSLVVLNRQLRLGVLTILGIADQVLNYAVVMVWAYFSPTVWAFIAGALVSNLAYAIVSHFIVRGHRVRFHLNREDARWMFRFGRWVFLSTALTFLALQADKILLGRLLGAATLGVYGMAANYAMLPAQLVRRIVNQVALPALAEVARDHPEKFYGALRTIRFGMLGLALLGLLPLILAGPWIMDLMYEENWSDTGWMAQILALGSLAGVLNCSYGSALLARAQSHLITVLLAIQVPTLIAGSLIAFHFGHERGFVIAVACVDWFIYPFHALVMIRQRLWQPEVDLPVVAIAGAGFAWVLL